MQLRKQIKRNQAGLGKAHPKPVAQRAVVPTDIRIKQKWKGVVTDFWNKEGKDLSVYLARSRIV